MNLTILDIERLFSDKDYKSTDDIINHLYQKDVLVEALDDFGIVSSDTLDEITAQEATSRFGAQRVKEFLAEIEWWGVDYFHIDDCGNASNIPREDLRSWLEDAVLAANSKAMA